MAIIELEKTGLSFEAKNQSILDAALAASIAWPHQCRSGECGMCRCRLLEGHVHKDPALPGVIEADEEAQGVILACRCRPKSDLALALDQPLPPPIESVQGRLAEREQLDENIFRLVIEAERKVEFKPGQYAEISIAGSPPRAYSFANRSGSADCEFLFKRVPDGEVSPLLCSSPMGHKVSLRLPLGSAFWQENSNPVILIGCGTGVAPTLAIRRAIEAAGMPVERQWIAIGADWAKAYIKPQTTDIWLNEQQREQLLDYAARSVAQQPGAACHFAGSPKTLEAIKPRLLAAGLPAKSFFADPFWTPQPAPTGIWSIPKAAGRWVKNLLAA